MFNGYDFGLFGHIHKPQILSMSPYIAHVGSMDLSDFGESDHQKILTVFDPNKDQPLKYIDIPTRPLRQVSVSVPDNIINATEYVLKELGEQVSLNKAIVKLNVVLNNPNTVSIDRIEVEAALNKLGAYHIARISEEKRSVLIKKTQANDIDNTMNEMTAVKMYSVSNIDEEYQSEFISLATDIINECKAEKVA
jgi:DNA repair exonuclease SbcCD nuclease subunit